MDMAIKIFNFGQLLRIDKTRTSFLESFTISPQARLEKALTPSFSRVGLVKALGWSEPRHETSQCSPGAFMPPRDYFQSSYVAIRFSP